MSKDEFDLKLTRAFMQAKAGEGIAADEFFESLKSEVIKSHAE